MNKEEREQFISESTDFLQNVDFSADEYNSALKELQTIKQGEELPWKVQRFCSEYVISYNEEKAARLAGWPPLNALMFGRRLLANQLVRKEIERLQKNITKKLQITQERVLTEWASIAYCNLIDFYDEEGKLIPIHKLERQLAASIQDIVYDRRGNIKGYKLLGKSVALDALSKSLGIFDKDSERTLPFDFQQFLSMQSEEDRERLKIACAKRIGPKK